MLSKWCQVTTCAGILDLYEARNRKIHFTFWAIVLIIMVLCCAWFTYKAIAEYFLRPVVTNVATVRSESMDLPEILLCYNGGLNVSEFKESNISDNFIHVFSASFYDFNFEMWNVNEMTAELYHNMNKHNIGIKDFAEKHGFKCEDMLMTFTNSDNSVTTCDEASLMITQHGNCFKFKSKSSQNFPGVLNGAYLRLKEPKNAFVHFYPEDSINLDLNHEFTVTLEKNLGPYHSLRSIVVPVDAKTVITLNTKLYTREGEGKYCQTNENIYNSNSCFLNCWLEEIQHRFDCVPLNMAGNYSNYNICNPFEYHWSRINNTKVDFCSQQNCLPLCEEWIFEATVTHSSYSSLGLNKSTTEVLIGYNTMQYTKVFSFLHCSDKCVANIFISDRRSVTFHL